jgi:hypothetical protein
MPPRGVKGAKRARQYEKIKASARKRGRSTGTAKRIAAATVNKQRRQAGETKGSRKGAGGARTRKGGARKGGARKRAGGARKTSRR